LWNTSDTTQDLTNRGAGFYRVTVTDLNGCIARDSFNLTEPDSLTITSLKSNFNGSSVSCKGSTNGSIDITVTKGTAPYTYLWNTSDTTQDLTNRGAGFYRVTVTDRNGCIARDSFNLTEPDSLTLVSLKSDFNGSGVSCYGSTNGSIDVTVTKGTGPYTYLWNTSDTTQDLTNIGSGFYRVTVTDLNGCVATDSFNISQPDSLNRIFALSNFNNYHVSCANSKDGAIDVNVSGGKLPYTYLWNTSDTTQDLKNIGAGLYKIVITDHNGCTAADSFTLIQPQALSDSVFITGATCSGANGKIDLTVKGGVSPYTFLWSNGSNTEDLNNVTGGIYNVNITDKNGCTLPGNYTVGTSVFISLSGTSTSLKCYGDNSGAVNITMLTGTAPYKYIWSSGDTTEDLQGIAAGLYRVTVIDSYGCTVSDSFLVTSPTALQGTISTSVYYGGFNISRYLGVDGWAEIALQGGTPPYTILWSNGQPEERIENLYAGRYSVVATDYNGCSIADTVKLKQPVMLEMPSGYSPNGDNKNDFFIVHGIEAFPNNVITVYNRWGNVVYTKDNYNNEWNGEDMAGSALPDATYYVVLKVNGGEITLTGYVDLRRQ
jgi:gliding motility-associated-like protein